jgi:predicted permease
LAFALVLAVVTAGVTTALSWLASRGGIAQIVRQGGRGSTGSRHLTRATLIALQVAVSAVLLVGAGLLLRSLDQLQRVDLGFDPERVLTAEVSLNWSRYTSNEDRVAFFERTLEELRSRPGVVKAAAGVYSPLSNQGPSNTAFVVEGQPLEDGQPPPQLDLRTASTEFFEALAIPLLAGRTFETRDTLDAPAVAVINRSLAERTWGVESALGRRLSVDGGTSWVTVVGVVGDIRQYGLDTAAADELYLPLAQGGFASRLLVRTAADPLSLAGTLKAAVHAVDPDQPVSNLEALEQRRREHLAAPRLTASLLGAFAAIAVVLAAAGIGGLMAYAVSERRKEIGLRMALGAQRSSVLAIFLRGGLAITVAGLALGALGSLAFVRVLEASLFQVPSTDPKVLAVVALTLLAIGTLAAGVPAWRAARTDPTEALHEE